MNMSLVNDTRGGQVLANRIDLRLSFLTGW